MRGATVEDFASVGILCVSIHAPHAGRDRSRLRWNSIGLSFNPRAPCGARLTGLSFLRKQGSFNPRAPCGARLLSQTSMRQNVLFQSTRPMRGATGPAVENFSGASCFNPRAPCGARHSPEEERYVTLMFQSTRPMRGATKVPEPFRVLKKFQSTRPMRGATCVKITGYRIGKSFNPRAPCGARPVAAMPPPSGGVFQSTRPMRGATLSFSSNV